MPTPGQPVDLFIVVQHSVPFLATFSSPQPVLQLVEVLFKQATFHTNRFLVS